MYSSEHNNSVLLRIMRSVGGVSEVNAVDVDCVVCSNTEPN